MDATSAPATPPVARDGGGPWARTRLPLVLGGAAAAAVVLVAVRSPYEPLSYGICPSVLLLGVWCPGCGGLRATHDLAHLDLVGAWQANPLWVLVVPLLLAAWVRWLVLAARGRPVPAAPGWLPWALLAVVVGFAVLRNVPALVPYLAPV
ncbi:DUF2752 domain-containing protein [Cellulomonas oligotrophica]|uniref:Membrane protein n=1 Tax=Cellulomonas oligotrophica TaxID=931536 RepID=A0A7Y9FCN3_9CELL|nr:DUF2752 domain-containing protein [Cellulomonas oligotrophica]NYD84878.1 hypothetical protein [Cellulomonas oligotrophica]GIG31947.1 membrane protein [Cellulomonas oligotrophica]